MAKLIKLKESELSAMIEEILKAENLKKIKEDETLGGILKKVKINGYTFYVNDLKRKLYLDELGKEGETDYKHLTPNEREQIYNQLHYKQPMINHDLTENSDNEDNEELHVISYNFGRGNDWKRGYIRTIWSTRLSISQIIFYDLLDSDKKLIKRLKPSEAEELLAKHKIVKGQNLDKNKLSEENGKVGTITEKLMLSNFNEYAKLVAESYENAPLKEPGTDAMYAALNASNHKLYKQILSKVKVEFVDYDPYQTRDEMANDVAKNKILKIYSGHNEHPYFSKEDNLIFRTVHDWYTHIISKQDFSLRGELKAYNTHAKLAPPQALPVLFTEVVGQVCYKIVKGDFPVQKMCILKGFDFKNVGKVDNIDIINKELQLKK